MPKLLKKPNGVPFECAKHQLKIFNKPEMLPPPDVHKLLPEHSADKIQDPEMQDFLHALMDQLADLAFDEDDGIGIGVIEIDVEDIDLDIDKINLKLADIDFEDEDEDDGDDK